MHRFASLLSLLAVVAFASEPYQSTTYHQDLQRADQIKLDIIKPTALAIHKDATALEIAETFMASQMDRYGLESLDAFSVIRVQESLMGTHIHFGQKLNGYPIHRAEFIVSVNHNNEVFMVYNNTYRVLRGKNVNPPEVFLNWDDAYDVAWEDLRVHGDLTAYPQAELVYLPEGDSFRLVYLVRTAVEAPFGYWQHTIDAINGEVLDVVETSIDRNARDDFDFASYEGPVENRAAAISRFEAKMASDMNKVSAVAATGSGKVFDPDPVTTLQNDTLEDNSPASSFTAAYFTRSLLDISLSSGTYRLNGPWVTISNFESPNTSPSTTTNGSWTASRGNNAFNDAMTYFHVDQSQRYMQSLGFSGSTGIQYNSIVVDTDGANGDDNSYFQPASNRMAFGHGCVDDNEDAFVILHEYGHAIHHSINNNWSGGDTGGMGEGFGDYWAGSYRYSTPNGASFHPEWAFPFDGHNNCWGGRNMNKTNYQYVHSNTYGAHATVGGVYSDELWSTPLFQSMVTLRGQGVPRSEIDRIVLQAHFGLGSGLKMRDMANAIVSTAQSLYPSGNHAAVFQQKFEAQSILTGSPPPPPPTSVLQNGVPVANLGAAQGSSTYFTLAVPSGASNLSFTLSGGSGDADLYVRRNSQPTTSTYDYRSWNGSNNESISVPSPTSGTYHVLIYGYATYSGATLTASYQTSSNQAPNASFTSSVNGLTVNLTDTSTDDGSISSWSWNFGDGTTSSQRNPSKTYSSGGTYTITLTVTDNGGLTDSASSNVTVTAPNIPPTASFTQSINNLSVNFTSTSTDQDGTITSHSWNFGDGSTSSSTNPSRTYASAGTYTVSLTVTDNGGLSNTTSKSITVTAPPTGNVLQNGVGVAVSGAQGSSTYYTISVPAGASNLAFNMSGGSGDADLYVKFGSQPTTSSFDYRSWNGSNNESISVSSASAGTYHVLVYGYAAYSGATLTASYTTGGGGPTTRTETGTVGGRKSVYYDVTVSGGTISLNCTWTPTSRDLDLYIYNPSGTRVASATSTSHPETLTYNTNGVAGTYRVRVYDYSSSSASYTLTMTYQP
ncbi:MAG: pre-peptidase C-terminal domain-containing protein [Acidobacteria bacterium]|nr:pre-peptidase C-terminal domain-containing protein [Acidobacteriota bacterium]